MLVARRREGVGPGVKIESQREVRNVAMGVWDGDLRGLCESRGLGVY